MAVKKQKAKSRTQTKVLTGYLFFSALVGTLMNMTATVTTVGSVLLCLVVARHFN